ncbi:two-component sensor histidine kinase, partial [Enterococcus faecium]
IEDGIERTSAQERHPEGHKYESKIAVQVWSQDGQLLLRSANAGTHPLQPMEVGYHVVNFDGYEWVGFSLFAEDLKVWVFTAQREDVRGELSFHLTIDQLLPLSFAVIPIFI